MSRIFLTNATGYVGSAIAKVLKEKGYEVSAIARNEESQKKLDQAGIKAYPGDLNKPEAIVQAAQNADVIIHTAQSNDAEFAKYDAQLVDQLLQALKGKNKTFIYTSGTWVHGDTGSQPATEESPLKPTQLVTWRPDVERRVQQAGNAELRTIVLRPALVYGNNGGIVSKLFADANQTGEVKFIGDGENHWATVHVEDLADGYVLAIEKAKTGSIYNLSGPSYKVKEVAEHVAKTLPNQAKAVGYPVEQARTRLGVFADALTLDQKIDSAKAQRELGWQPKRHNLLEDIKQNGKQLATSAK